MAEEAFADLVWPGWPLGLCPRLEQWEAVHSPEG